MSESHSPDLLRTGTVRVLQQIETEQYNYAGTAYPAVVAGSVVAIQGTVR